MARYGYPAAGGERGKILAADVDRDRVAAALNTAYVEGRLSSGEHDARLHGALSARTYADLDRLVADLPVGPGPVVFPAQPPFVPPAAKTNGLAIASLACGLSQFVLGPLPTIPAIVLGHLARGQIRRTGEQGAGLALAGLILGWVTVILGVIAIGLLTVTATRGGTAPPNPQPVRAVPARLV
jgi:hypothetical protein